jgi:hypothetical protein
MAIMATLIGLIGRFTGKLLTMSLGWASVLLFGRVPRDREVFLAAITFGSILWAVLLIAMLIPGAGVWLLSFTPVPTRVDDAWIRLGMLAVVIVLPPVLGATTLKLLQPEDRPSDVPALAAHVLRGYPLAAGLSLMLVFLGMIGVVRKVASLARRWTDTHIPIVVKPRGYARLATDLDEAISDAGIDVSARDAPAVMVIPGRVLAALGGIAVRGLVPDRLVQLTGRDVEVLIYPNDVAITGREHVVARVQAALASRLTTTQAWMTMTEEGQAIEDRLARLTARRPEGAERTRALASIDRDLATDNLPYDEWEVLYRHRLQLERDLLLGLRPGEAMPAASESLEGAASTKPQGLIGRIRRDPVGTAFGAAGLGLAALNAALLLAERRHNR